MNRESMRPNKEDKPPFKDDFAMADFLPSEKFYKLKALENNPDVVVRKDEFPIMTPSELRERRKELQIFKKLCDELQEQYGIHLPDSQLVVGVNDSNQKMTQIYTVVERIYGDNIEEALKQIGFQPIRTELEMFYGKLLDYFDDKYEKHAPMISDLFNFQLMYGHRRGEKKDHIYFVDLDPFFTKKRVQYRVLPDIAQMIGEAELSTGEKLINTRERFKETFSKLSPTDQRSLRENHHYIQSLLE